MTDDELKRQLNEADGAQALLDSADFQRIMRKTREHIMAKWAGEDDPARREDLHAEIRGLRTFMDRLKREIDTGKLARASRDAAERRDTQTET
jgi:hypothetical protein